jgi:hypothetical protein
MIKLERWSAEQREIIYVLNGSAVVAIAVDKGGSLRNTKEQFMLIRTPLASE